MAGQTDELCDCVLELAVAIEVDLDHALVNRFEREAHVPVRDRWIRRQRRLEQRQVGSIDDKGRLPGQLSERRGQADEDVVRAAVRWPERPGKWLVAEGA